VQIGTAAAEGYRLVVIEQDPNESADSAEAEEGLTAPAR
jgi:hypothetical protein